MFFDTGEAKNVLAVSFHLTLMEKMFCKKFNYNCDVGLKHRQFCPRNVFLACNTILMSCLNEDIQNKLDT